MSEKILREFEEKREMYETLTSKASSLIREILAAHDLNIHSISQRTKNRSSLTKKLGKSGKDYKELSDVTDISGIRVTTYFEDDVDRVTKIIEQEFEIDETNSIDKRRLLDPDRFGYLSTHHVVTMLAARGNLPEHKRFIDIKFEIQTRSILQHAWAEIEHDLGYKSKAEIPRDIRRKFSRLAGLLELADSEFIAIRDELGSYEQLVQNEVKTRPDRLEINKSSLVAFVHSSEIVRELDQAIAAEGRWRLAQNEDSLTRDIEKLHYAGLFTIGALGQALIDNKNVVKKFSAEWLKDRNDEGDRSIGTGICIFYLIYVLLGRSPDATLLSSYLLKFKIGDDEGDWPEELVSKIRRVLSKD